MRGRLIHGDAAAEVARLPPNSVDLIMTSPPYADARAAQYGGPPPAEYGAWYLPIAKALRRALKPSGSYVLNLKEGREPDGQRSLYVSDLLAAHVRHVGWRWHDTFVWRKTSHARGNFGPRLADAWEPCFQFCKGPRPYIDKRANRTPLKAQTVRNRAAYAAASPAERRRAARLNAHGSGIEPGHAHASTAPTAQAVNVIECGVAGSGRRGGYAHPAMFPVALPTWFIRLLCPPDGLVLDPFAGAGTTAVAAEREGRTWIAIERSLEYVRGAERRLAREPKSRQKISPPRPRGERRTRP